MIHEQVQRQLDYLKALVDAEKENERQCKEWNIPYTESRRKWEDIREYEDYKKEIEKNGDKNLLVMVRMDGTYNMYGVYPFARRHVDMKYGDYFLVHYRKHGGEILFRESEVDVVK